MKNHNPIKYACGGLLALAAILSAGCATSPSAPSGTAPGAEQPVMLARRADAPVRLDGKLDDPAWQKAAVYQLHKGLDRADPPLKEPGAVRLLWDADYLYVGVKYSDSDVVQEGATNQTPLYGTGDLVEVFLKPATSTWYWEIYGTPNGLQSVFWFASPGRRLLSSIKNHAMRDLKVAAEVRGTLNDWRDRDDYWTAELAIPAKELTQYGDAFGPGSDWRILIARYNYAIGLPECELSMAPQLTRTVFRLLDEYAVLKFEE